MVIIECVAQMQAHDQIWATRFRPGLGFGFRERNVSFLLELLDNGNIYSLWLTVVIFTVTVVLLP